MIVWNMHLEGMIFLYYGTPTIIPSIREKKKVNVHSESSVNMPTNERKITKLLPLPMLYVVRLEKNLYFAKGKAQRRAKVNCGVITMPVSKLLASVI